MQKGNLWFIVIFAVIGVWISVADSFVENPALFWGIFISAWSFVVAMTLQVIQWYENGE